MARIARVVAPGIPHHLTQRGNRRQPTFFDADDYRAYRVLMGEWCRYWHGEVWAYCLMPNIEQNPVKAGLADRPWEYPWSSAAAHVTGEDDGLVTVGITPRDGGSLDGLPRHGTRRSRGDTFPPS